MRRVFARRNHLSVDSGPQPLPVIDNQTRIKTALVFGSHFRIVPRNAQIPFVLMQITSFRPPLQVLEPLLNLGVFVRPKVPPVGHRLRWQLSNSDLTIPFKRRVEIKMVGRTVFVFACRPGRSMKFGIL